MIRKLLLIFCFLYGISAAAQSRLTLDTAPLGGAGTVILPTYSNLVKLKMLDSAQFRETMAQYQYSQCGKAGDCFSADGSTGYYTRKNQHSIAIFFDVSCECFKKFEDDIIKRFPNAEHSSILAVQQYAIIVNDDIGAHSYQVSIIKSDPDETGCSAILSDN